MTEVEAPKRLEPRMSRGGFRFQFVLWSTRTALQMVIVGTNLVLRGTWDAVDYVSLTAMILGLTFLSFLLHVRRKDGHFRNGEEAKRATFKGVMYVRVG
jgi:hypothetical protein